MYKFVQQCLLLYLNSISVFYNLICLQGHKDTEFKQAKKSLKFVAEDVHAVQHSTEGYYLIITNAQYIN